MSFKFFRGNNLEWLTTNHVQEPMLIFRNVEHTNNEFCFQFDDEEPVVFANGNSSLTINVSPNGNGNITFNQNNRRFKIFAREHGNEEV